LTKLLALTITFLVAADVCALASPPNVVFLLCDDLGYGDLGCFGQKKFYTPNIDRMAAEGMRLTRYYSGHNVCAPSRCVLMTGKHPGHTYIRDNRGGLDGQEGQEPVPEGSLSLPLAFKKAGYVVGGFGKWGLGPVGSSGDPLNQGFDRFFGYNCQAVAHNLYPGHLWNGREKVFLDNPLFSAHQKFPADGDPKDRAAYARYQGKEYAPDLIHEQALAFVRENKDRPFFLYVPSIIPHLALQVPDDSLGGYTDLFEEKPYLGEKGYLPHHAPRAAYAAMISRMDREVGRLRDLLRELGLEKNTIFVFTSDNGAAEDGTGGTDATFFHSTRGLRGRKGSYYEGGFRVPCIVHWPEKIALGTVRERIVGAEDWLPTLLELTGHADLTPPGIDGISMAPTLLGKEQPPREFLYRESPGYGGQQTVLSGDWKAIRTNLNPGKNVANPKYGEWELYHLDADTFETKNVADAKPEVLKRLVKIADREHVKSELFPIRAID
jgi:arylsulfatase A